METEPSEVRFGVLAVKMGFVSPDQTVKAMDVQVREDLSTGGHRPLGAILLDLGFITQIQLDKLSSCLTPKQDPD
jgi:hypothetical protein